MPLLKLEDVQEALVKLNLHYPEAGHNPATIADISEDYFDDLKGWSQKSFLLVVQEIRRSCGFWPKVKDFYKVYSRIQERKIPEKDKLALPVPKFDDPETVAQAELNRKCAKILGLAINKRISFEEAEKRIETLRNNPLY